VTAPSHDEPEDQPSGPRANLLAWGSVVVGTLVLLGQSIGCLLPVLGIAILMVATLGSLALGLAGYRQALQHDYAGLDGALLGLSFAAVNVLLAGLWMVWSLFFILIGVIILLNQ
jgi:hypothetical protein